jgi:predicted DNA-binding transcriptional regulator AlpA
MAREIPLTNGMIAIVDDEDYRFVARQKWSARCSPSKRLSVTRGTLAGWRCTKRYDLPFVKIGRVIRYRESDIQNFLEQHTVRQASGDPNGGSL